MSEDTEISTPKNSKLLLRMHDLKIRYGLAPATVYGWISEGSFPAPVNIGEKCVAWHLEEIERWRMSRPRAKIRLVR